MVIRPGNCTEGYKDWEGRKEGERGLRKGNTALNDLTLTEPFIIFTLNFQVSLIHSIQTSKKLEYLYNFNLYRNPLL